MAGKKNLEIDIEEKTQEKKQVLLRISARLWNDLAGWAEDDFRSINGQIEFLLTEAVKKRKNKKD
jgi:hypothetical protein